MKLVEENTTMTEKYYYDQKVLLWQKSTTMTEVLLISFARGVDTPKNITLD